MRINTKKVNVDLSELPLDDPQIYELISSGETTGIFPIGKSGDAEVGPEFKTDKIQRYYRHGGIVPTGADGTD